MQPRIIIDQNYVLSLMAKNHMFIPPPELTWLRENDPISPIQGGLSNENSNGWLITNYYLARTVLSDARFGVVKNGVFSQVEADGGPATAGNLLRMDPPRHTKYRRTLASYFTMRGIAKLQKLVEANVEAQLNLITQMSPPIDFKESFALPVTSSVIFDILGIPRSDRPRYRSNGAPQLSLNDIAHLLYDLIIFKRKHPQDDLLTRVASFGGEITDDDLSGLVTHLLVGNIDNPARMIAQGLIALFCHREQLEQLQKDPTLIDTTIDELLRYVCIFPMTARSALENLELGSKLVRKGDTIVIALHAANHDPDRFEDPDTLNIRRKNCGHLSFSHGIHRCIGMHLARAEMRSAYIGLVKNLPTLRLDKSAQHLVTNPVCDLSGPEFSITW